MTKNEIRDDARSQLLHAMVAAISVERETEGSTDVVKAMEAEATKLAKRWGWFNWPGLPGTYSAPMRESAL